MARVKAETEGRIEQVRTLPSKGLSMLTCKEVREHAEDESLYHSCVSAEDEVVSVHDDASNPNLLSEASKLALETI
eukprot:scaffold90_cov264-Pinguiococcus_pyrenoidosus.AAC.21